MGQKIDLTQQVQGILPEANGGAGPNAGMRFSDAETPSGALNGSNKNFTLTQSPSPAQSLLLFLDKVLQIQGTDYTLSGASITMTTAPSGATASFLAWYRYLSFGQAYSFSDGLSMADSVQLNLMSTRIPLSLIDSMTLRDSKQFMLAPPSFATEEALSMADAFVFLGVSPSVLSDQMTMSDSFAKTLA